MNTIETGSVIDPYRVETLLGQGGMAQVWKARHSDLHRFEALKVLPPQLAFDRAFTARFLAEAKTTARLQHPNIAAIHAVSSADAPQPYFAMELIEGGDLADFIEAHGQFSLEAALPILEQIGAALDYAHGQGVIHRDIKPANVMLTGGERVKVVDFGIARAQEEAGGTRMTQAGMILGSPPYMSPEQGGSGAAISSRSDIYSLGIIAYEMLCGQPPFHESAQTSAIAVIMEHIRTPPPDPRTLNPAIMPATVAAIESALAKNPDDRPATAKAFIETLRGERAPLVPAAPIFDSAAARSAPAYAPAYAQPTPTQTGGGKKWVPALLGLVLLGGVALIGYSLGDKGDSKTVTVILPESAPAPVEEVVTPQETEPPPDEAESKPVVTRDSEAEIREFFETWRTARQTRDGETMATLYSPNASRVDGDRQSIGKFQSVLEEETYDQPRVSVDVNNLKIYQRGKGEAVAVFQQHFKGWGRDSSRNWESRGDKKVWLSRGADGWKITHDTYKRTYGSRF